MTLRPTRPAAVTRRQVVTTAGHLAWSTPLIVAASAAPAFAASGAAAIVTSQPSFTIPTSHVRVTTQIRNQGTVAPASMLVTVQLTPTQGGLQDVDPTVLGTDFILTDRTAGPTAGSQILTFAKTEPQVPPATTTTLRFDFFATSSPGGIKQGNVFVSPSVPVPGTATSNGANYLSTVSS